MSVITKDLGIATAYGYAKSKGYTGTEEEFAELMASYADVAEQAEAAAQDAEDAKDEAVTAKTDAQTAKTAAQAAQSAAETASGTASTKASEAAQSAQTAAGSATAAGNSATAAAGSATTAQAAQANAEAAAASVSASAAQIEQNTAYIGQIKNDLSEKADKTEALSAYIVETETGSIASFTDGADNVPVKDLTVAIEPVQDLHGQSAPYPAGGGKNKFDVTTVSTQTYQGVTVSRTNEKLHVSGTASASGNFAICNFSLPTGTYYLSSSVEGNGLVLLKGYTYVVAQGSFTVDDATATYRLAVPITSGTAYNYDISDIMIETGSSKTTYAPYSNICPISGWTGLSGVRTGKNWLPQGSVTLPSENNWIDYASNFPSGTYTLSLVASVTGGLTFNFKDSNNTTIATTSQTVTAGQRFTHTFNVTRDAVKVIGYYNKAGTVSDIQLELGSTATAYEPYQGETYEVDWTTEAGTVYGGTLDVTIGVLTVDRAMVDLGDQNWQYDTSTEHPSFWAYGLGTLIKPVPDNNTKGNIICTMYKTITANEGFSGTETIGACLNTSPRFIIYDPNYSSVSAFKTAVTGQKLVYELNTPQTFQLTAHEVSTILGQNNIWADCGNVTVQYRADTKLYIDKVINA